ncbi:MAG: hypothetical protein ACM3MK_10580 [Chitinophagales bacterium]
MRYGACDIGTNSCRLLVAQIVSGDFSILEKKVVTTRIGEGMGHNKWLKPKAIDRTLDCLSRFVEDMHRWQVMMSTVVATSAVRESMNQFDFLILAQERTGFDVEVLSGEKEGYLSYLGVKKSFNMKAHPVVVDVGGGSVEFSYHRRKVHSMSIPVGAVKATEADWDETDIKNLLGERISDLPLSPLVLVGGTATSMVAIKKEMKRYNPKEVQGEKLSLSDISDLYQRLNGMTIEQKRELTGLQPERADIMEKGVLIIKSIMELMGRKQALVSDSDLLDGIIWSLHDQNVSLGD